MGKEVLVSVIIPVYNAGKFIEECLDSVVNQTLNNIEIICVDDGSTDSSSEILTEFCRENDKIRVLHQEKTNAGAARNRGMRAANGKYLSFLDADDTFGREMLETAYRIAEERKADIVVVRSDMYDQRTGAYERADWTIREDLLSQRVLEGETFQIHSTGNMLNALSGFAWDKLFRAEFIKRNNIWFQEQEWINDRLFVECALACAERVVISPEVLVHKRINVDTALTSAYFEGNRWMYWFEAIREIRKKFVDLGIYQDLEKEYRNFAAHYILWNVEQFIERECFPNLYEYATTKFIDEIGLGEMDKDAYYDASEYEWIGRMKKLSASEYKWELSLSKEEIGFLFPFDRVPRGGRIILYGAGKMGRIYYKQIRKTDWCEIVAWVDRNHRNLGSRVEAPERIHGADWDYVVVAIKDGSVVEDVRRTIENFGAEPGKII